MSLFFGVLAALALTLKWTTGKALLFMIATALTGMAVIHLTTLGVIGELVVGTSDLSHTELPEITKKTIASNAEEQGSEALDHSSIYLPQTHKKK